MKKKLAMGALAVLVTGPMFLATPGFAQNNDYRYSDQYRREYAYRGQDREYRRKCGGGNGAVGTIGGGVGGALIGNSLGGGVGTVLGGVGGALLGRHLDKENTRNKNGC